MISIAHATIAARDVNILSNLAIVAALLFREEIKKIKKIKKTKIIKSYSPPLQCGREGYYYN